MNIDTAQAAAKIIEKISELSKYKRMVLDKDSQNAHFAVVQNCGTRPNIIDFNSEYNPKFVALIEEIISELKTELASL